MTGRHRGPKQKLRAGYRVQSRNQHAMCHQSYFCLLDVTDCNARNIFPRRVCCRAVSLHDACIPSLGIILTP